jgi:hypothetical protein
MRRKSERQRFGSGHKICQNAYQRFRTFSTIPAEIQPTLRWVRDGR